MKSFTDPVCGMTVGEDSLRIGDSETVAFCGPGCRTAFLADPPAYLPDLTAPASADLPSGDHDHDH